MKFTRFLFVGFWFFFHVGIVSADEGSARLYLIPEEGRPGDTIVVLIQAKTTLSDARIEYADRVSPVFPVQASSTPTADAGSSEQNAWPFLYRALVGIALDDPPGEHSLMLHAKGDGERPVRIDRTFIVNDRVFQEEHIDVPPAKRSLLTAKALKEEAESLWIAVTKYSENQAWTGKFLMPVQGRISSPFGMKRVYSDGIAKWQHRGVDIAPGDGVPILSPNNGTVVLAKAWTVHGNTLVIDHGQGVFSIMNHLKDLIIEEGKHVEKGRLIGNVGSTGLATGPHLHWGLSVGNVRVDPLEWVNRSMDPFQDQADKGGD